MQLLYFYDTNNTACRAIEDHIPAEAKQISVRSDVSLCERLNVVAVPLFIVLDDNGKEAARIMTNNTTKIVEWYKGVCNGHS